MTTDDAPPAPHADDAPVALFSGDNAEPDLFADDDADGVNC